ncbi:MAG: LysM peptidoglycan-binding domain-containing protein [Smithella sp.]|jgi:membrane-bound lytic murein transglycosylase D
MLKCKKYVPFFGLVLCLSVAILLFTGIHAQAENEPLNGTRLNSKLSVNEKNLVLSEMAVGSDKRDVSDASDENQADKDTKVGVEEEQDLMENALELLEMADNYWKKGDIENTLNELDKAYALLLDTNGDVEIARQKDDLRLLISRRILAVYSSQETRTNGKASEILLSLNADVEKEIRSFQGPEREFFISSYHRSGMYKEIIVGELKKAGVPEELFWLPLVESGFKVGAYSRARALGLWQFIPSTGYKFGLTRDEWVDERMDVLKSTHAAIAYLKELHAMFGDWMTVLASYNCGEGRVLRVISRQHVNYFDRFWDLYSKLPNETARYVPRFLATLHIIKDPGKYGFDLKTTADSLMDYEMVKVNKMMKLSDVASKMEVSEDVINILNAELRYKVTPNYEYTIKIPKNSTQKFNLVYSEIPEAERPAYAASNRSNGRRSAYIKHRVRPGENVASIAKRYRVSSQSIYQSNRINKNKRLTKGRIIRIPIDGVETASMRQKTTGGKNIAARKTAGSHQTYKVKKGDSLLGIANKFHVPVAKLKKMNNLKTNSIQAGRILKISHNEVGDNRDGQQGEENNMTEAVGKKNVVGKTLTNQDVAQLGTNKHIVTKGESLSIISRKYKIEMAKLIQMNHLSEHNAITPGQVLVVK